MVSFSKKKSKLAFWATLIYALIVVLAVCLVVFLKKPVSGEAEKDEYDWIISDPAAKSGMLDGSFYKGEKNSSGTLSYKIAEEIIVDGEGKGDFKI